MFKGKYGAKLEFPEGWGDSNQKAFSGRDMDISLNNTIAKVFLAAVKTCTRISEKGPAQPRLAWFMLYQAGSHLGEMSASPPHAFYPHNLQLVFRKS